MGATATLSRRSFLRGRARQIDAFRPPWSPAEDVFTDECRRCGDCIAVCETGLLIKGSGGFPEADFSKAGCTFCEACIKACRYQVIEKGNECWALEARINDSCLAQNKVHCRTCQESCETEAISFQLIAGGIARPAIDTSLCTGCGECVSGCSAGSISIHRKPSPTV